MRNASVRVTSSIYLFLSTCRVIDFGTVFLTAHKVSFIIKTTYFWKVIILAKLSLVFAERLFMSVQPPHVVNVSSSNPLRTGKPRTLALSDRIGQPCDVREF